MPTPLQGLVSPRPSSSNQSLLGAALAGLLCLAPAACSSKEDRATGFAGAGPSAGGGAGDPGGAGGGSTRATGGAPPEVAHITSSAPAGVLTEADFKALCDARSGTVEVMPHCGGFATAKGFSYDDATLLISEHTCAGANTCGGWNCVLVD
jgi:hypothetical protein